MRCLGDAARASGSNRGTTAVCGAAEELAPTLAASAAATPPAAERPPTEPALGSPGTAVVVDSAHGEASDAGKAPEEPASGIDSKPSGIGELHSSEEQASEAAEAAAGADGGTEAEGMEEGDSALRQGAGGESSVPKPQPERLYGKQKEKEIKTVLGSIKKKVSSSLLTMEASFRRALTISNGAPITCAI